MPIDQMLVNITRPMEEAVNSVTGLTECWVDSRAGIGGSGPVRRLGLGLI